MPSWHEVAHVGINKAGLDLAEGRGTGLYGKVFEDIFCSTLMEHGGDTAYVFIAMIVLSDERGFVKHTAGSLARLICKPLEVVAEAVRNLELADPSSNIKAHDGRRIVPLREIMDDENRGWLVVNKSTYRERGSRDDKLRADRDRIAKKRKAINGVANSRIQSHSVADVAHTDTYTDTKNKNTVGQRPDVMRVLQFLNEKTGRGYKPVKANLELIAARLKEGASVDDCRAVIAKKCREWLGDEKMAMYLRPATLFNRTKFAQYQGELGAEEPAGVS